MMMMMMMNNWETVVETGKLRWATYRFDPYDRHNLLLLLLHRPTSVNLTYRIQPSDIEGPS